MIDRDRTAVTGRRLLRAVALAVASAIIVGVITYFALQPAGLATVTKSQLVALMVYAALFGGLCSQFQPVVTQPLALRPTGIRNALLALGTWTGALGAIILTYFCLGFVFGNPHQIGEEITARALGLGPDSAVIPNSLSSLKSSISRFARGASANSVLVSEVLRKWLKPGMLLVSGEFKS